MVSGVPTRVRQLFQHWTRVDPLLVGPPVRESGIIHKPSPTTMWETNMSSGHKPIPGCAFCNNIDTRYCWRCKGRAVRLMALAPFALLLTACDSHQPPPACPPVPDTWLGLAHEWGPGIGGGVFFVGVLWLATRGLTD